MKKMKNLNFKGCVDNPKSKIGEDIFGMNKYIKGLCNFIRQCPTPTTISIQGDWGSGKTSFMQMIDNELKNEVYSIWINTWQFSQFNLGDTLPIMVLTKLVDTLSVKDKFENEAKRAVLNIAKVGVDLMAAKGPSLSGVDVNGAVDRLIVGISYENVTASISKLKKHFQDCVDDCLKRNGEKNRVVIFVDDLDRINPAKAVELLEVLKLFLDCEKCVFVLAMDYEVVIRGIDQKYEGKLGEDKGRKFFEKIVQVPFKIPVDQYNIRNYVENTLYGMGINTEKIDSYISLIRFSVGYNPRAMNRLFNTFLLICIINDEDGDICNKYDKDLYYSTLFAVICLQMSFEDIYNYLISNTEEEIESNFFEIIADSDKIKKYFKSDNGSDPASIVPEWIGELNLLENEEQAYKVCSFMEKFREAVAEDGKTFSKSDCKRVLEILNMASVTLVSNTSAGEYKNGRGTRYKYNVNDEFNYISEPFEKTNEPGGWNKSEITAFKLFGAEKR